MSLSKCISKFLAKSLLVSVGISFFDCSTSYMMEQYETKVDKKLIDNLIQTLETAKERKSLSHELLSGSSSDEEQSYNKNFLNKKRSNKGQDESRNFFARGITQQLERALDVKDNNKYVEKIHQSGNQEKDSKGRFNLNMLRITKLIYKLRCLNDAEELTNHPEVNEFLNKVDLIKDEAIKKHKVTVEQLLDFINAFSKILDKINSSYNKFNSIRKSLRIAKKETRDVKAALFRDGKVQKGLLRMLQTLRYCEDHHYPSPELLFADAIPRSNISCPKFGIIKDKK